MLNPFAADWVPSAAAPSAVRHNPPSAPLPIIHGSNVKRDYRVSIQVQEHEPEHGRHRGSGAGQVDEALPSARSDLHFDDMFEKGPSRQQSVSPWAPRRRPAPGPEPPGQGRSNCAPQSAALPALPPRRRAPGRSANPPAQPPQHRPCASRPARPAQPTHPPPPPPPPQLASRSSGAQPEEHDEEEHQPGAGGHEEHEADALSDDADPVAEARYELEHDGPVQASISSDSAHRKVGPHDFEILRVVGQGAFGKVRGGGWWAVGGGWRGGGGGGGVRVGGV
jgi:hypothetical protein